jgi:putative sterol carrier protein
MKDLLDKLSPDILANFENIDFEGLIKVELQDDSPLSCYLELNGKIEIKESIAEDKYPDMIIRGQSSDLSALLNGKMTFSDGFVSERVSFVGDLAKITTFKNAVQKALKA